MQRASVRERSFQSVRLSSQKAPKTVLRVIDGGAGLMPMWQELLGLLLFIFAHRKKKLEVATLPEKNAAPAFFDEVSDTGVREIQVYRPVAEALDIEFTDERLDEIIRDAVPVPKVRFQVSGEKPKQKTRKQNAVEVEEEPFPRKVSSHALGQFARAYLKARGRVGDYIDRQIVARLGKREASTLDYKERLQMRRLERRSLADQLLRIAKDEGKILRENQERLEKGIDVLHIGRGPTRSYFLRFDPKTGVVLSFHSSQGFNRHKAYRRARKKSFRENGRRFH